MFKQTALASLGFLVIAMSSPATAWIWRQEDKVIETKAFPIRLEKDGQAEDGVIFYRFIVNLTMDQKGSAWKGLKFKDDRRCEWSVTPRVERSVCFSTILGSTSCENELNATLDFGVSGKSVINNFIDHGTCSDDLSKATSQVNKVASDLTAQKDEIFKNDLNNVTEMLSGVKVTVDYEAEISAAD